MTTPDLAATWTAIHERTAAFLDGLSDDEAERTVPATEAWTVRELVAHVVGVGADALAGRSEADSSPGWTQGHVDQRAAASLSDIVLEWRSLAPALRDLLSTGPAEQVAPLCVDAFWHEQDLYTAFPDMPPVTDDPALQLGLEAFAGTFAQRVAQHELPSVRLVAGSWTSGDGDVEVSADRFELARALSGRRSASQVARFAWTADPAPYLPVFSMFGELRADDLVEQ